MINKYNMHEFQSGFHRHVEDLGIRHVYIKPRTPRLNGKVERSHKTDDIEFYQLLSYTGDVDLNKCSGLALQMCYQLWAMVRFKVGQ